MRTSSIISRIFFIKILTVYFVFQTIYPCISQNEKQINDLFRIDSTFRYGKLNDGLTYYIKSNNVPENMVYLKLLVKVGSTSEAVGERGMTHFIEHMAFKGTNNFQGNRIIQFIKENGGKFGNDLSAQTGPDETIYKLILPQSKNELISKAVDILYDWAFEISFDSAQIESEKKIIFSEILERMDANERIRTQFVPLLFKGSVYEDNKPIGKQNEIENFNRSSLINYYKRFYRPENLAIMVIGNINVDSVEYLIKQRFANRGQIPEILPSPQNLKMDGKKEFSSILAIDKELKESEISFFFKNHEKLRVENSQTFSQYLKFSVCAILIENRLKKLNFFANEPKNVGAKYAYLNRFLDNINVDFVIQALYWKEGLYKAAIELERIKQIGFSDLELNEAKNSMLNQIRFKYENKDKVDTRIASNAVTLHYLRQEPLLNPKDNLELTNYYLSKLTSDQVNATIKTLIKDENLFILVQLNDSLNLTGNNSNIVKEVYYSFSRDTLPEADYYRKNDSLKSFTTTSGRIINQRKHSNKVYEWDLSNGTSVLFYDNKDINNQFYFKAFRSRGLLNDSGEDLIDKFFLPGFFMQNGVGNFPKPDLSFFKEQHGISLMPYMDLFSEGFTGSANYDKLELFLKLFYLTVKEPLWDSTFKDYIQSSGANMFISPVSDPKDFLEYYIYSKLRGVDNDKIHSHQFSFDKFTDLYQKTYGVVDGVTFAFAGNLDTNLIKKLSEKYLASLPLDGSKREKANNQTLSLTPKDSNAVFRLFEERKALVNLLFTLKLQPDNSNVLFMSFIVMLMEERLRIKLREKHGIYAFHVLNYSYYFPNEFFPIFLVEFGSSIDQTDTLIDLINMELDSISHFGINKAEFESIKKQIQVSYEERYTRNSFWIDRLFLFSLYNQDIDIKQSFLDLNLEKITQKLKQALSTRSVSKYKILEK